MISHTKLIFGIIIIVLHLSLAGLFSQNNIPPQKQKSGLVTLTGRVLDRETKQPLIGTNVVIAGTNIGGSTDQNGNYTISNLTPGKYEIDFFYIGYKTERIKNFRVAANPGVRLDVQLEIEPLQLREIIVTPGQFAVMGRQPFVRQTLTKQNLQTIPFGEDVYRAITRLPGVSSEDYSARFTIRGGKNEDILVLMDGLQLYEPFHLKDVDGGVLSIVDVEAIKGIDLFTGGYPAEYGECMSGVFSINSSDAEEDRSQTSLGLSFMNSRFKSEGRFTHNRGSWLVSARRGYLDLILNMMGEKDAPQPVYYDLFGKVKYNMNKSQSISASILHSGDKLSFVEEEDGDEVSTRYGNSYGWLTLTSIINPRLFTRTMVSFGRITHNRQGTGYFDDTGDLEFIVADDNRVNIFGLKQDWDFEIDKRWLLKWGFYYNNETADYDYMNTLTHRTWIDNSNYMLKTDSTLAKLNPDGERYGGYLTNRFRIIKPLTIEAGLRYDRNTYAGDRYFSPRFNMVYALGKQTFLRGGWGYYYQSQRMHEIKAAWGETDFYPVQVAEHRVAGL